ncbi:hypothetical protein N0V94_007499 [Neodidymelliopsis sp. IMI 364377]|nr:hypothetical protein N0V94_007499 [Neodidymelliopsis sp. IMI 364377]
MHIGTADRDGDLYACMQNANSKFRFFMETSDAYQEVTVEDITNQRLMYPFDKVGPVAGVWGPAHFEHLDILLRYFFLRYDATVKDVFAKINNYEGKFKNALRYLGWRTKTLSPSEDCRRGCSSQDQASFSQADTENSQDTSDVMNPQEKESQPTPDQTEVDNAPASSALVTRRRISRASAPRPPVASSKMHADPAAQKNRTTSSTSGDESSEAASIKKYLESKFMLSIKTEVMGSTSAIRLRFQRLDECLGASLGSYESEVLCIGETDTQSNIYACMQAAKDNPEIHIYASRGEHNPATRVAEKNIGLGLNLKLSAPFRLVFSQMGSGNSDEVSRMMLLCKYYFVDAQKTQQRVFGGEPNYRNHIYNALKHANDARMWHERKTPDDNRRSNGVRAQTIADTESDDATDVEDLGDIPLRLAPTPRPSANEDEDGWVNVVPSYDAMFDQSPSPAATSHYEDDEDHPTTAQYEPNILHTPAESHTSMAEQSDHVVNTSTVLSAGAPRGFKRSAGDAGLRDLATAIEQKKKAHLDMLWKKHEERLNEVRKQRQERRLKEDYMILQEDAETAARRVEYERETERCQAMTGAEFLETCRKTNKEELASLSERLQLLEQEMRRKQEEMRREAEEVRRREASARQEAEDLELIATLQAMSQ